MHIINKSSTKGNLPLYVKHGGKDVMLEHEYGRVPVPIHALFIELTQDPDYWRKNKRYQDWFHKYPDWGECAEIYLAGLKVSESYWRDNDYVRLKQWGLLVGWDLFHLKEKK